MQWFRSQFREGYEVDGDILGLQPGECGEGKFLGRLVRYTTRGIEWEADPKQVESLVAEFGLETCNGVDTPGVKVDAEESVESMGASEASRFRRGAAKLNYLSQDRVDIAFVSKEQVTPHVESKGWGRCNAETSGSLSPEKSETCGGVSMAG